MSQRGALTDNANADAAVLQECIVQDLLPASGVFDSARKTFGFDRCRPNLAGERFDEEQILLGVYIGLHNTLEIAIEDIEEAAKRGMLVDFILEHYENIPEDRRGVYYPPFKARSHIRR